MSNGSIRHQGTYIKYINQKLSANYGDQDCKYQQIVN